MLERVWIGISAQLSNNGGKKGWGDLPSPTAGFVTDYASQLASASNAVSRLKSPTRVSWRKLDIAAFRKLMMDEFECGASVLDIVNRLFR